MSYLNLIVGLLAIWIGCAFVFGFRLWRLEHKDRYDWCCCGRQKLAGKDFHRTKNVIHRKLMCAPMREMIT